MDLGLGTLGRTLAFNAKKEELAKKIEEGHQREKETLRSQGEKRPVMQKSAESAPKMKTLGHTGVMILVRA